jgi:ATP-dependent DNA helicase RecQ
VLLRYFDEEMEACGNCDLCDSPADLFDGTEPVRMALSAILRTGEWFGAGHLIDILRGTLTEKVKAKGHEDLPTFGVGRGYDTRQWQAVFRQMMGYDLIRPDMERHGALRMTQAARPILRNEQTIELRRDTITKAVKTVAVKALVSEEDEPLLSALKAKRRALAQALQAPAYVVFPDATLIRMAEAKPETLDDFARLPGVGAVKLERYGKDFLEVINGAAEAPHPARRRLAGRDAGSLFDRLQAAQRDLAHGADGTDKLMSCPAPTLAKLAEQRPRDMGAMERILGARKAERFGPAFLDVLAEE